MRTVVYLAIIILSTACCEFSREQPLAVPIALTSAYPLQKMGPATDTTRLHVGKMSSLISNQTEHCVLITFYQEAGFAQQRLDSIEGRRYQVTRLPPLELAPWEQLLVYENSYDGGDYFYGKLGRSADSIVIRFDDVRKLVQGSHLAGYKYDPLRDMRYMESRDFGGWSGLSHKRTKEGRKAVDNAVAVYTLTEKDYDRAEEIVKK